MTGQADQRMTWDHAADHDLLTCLVNELAPSQDNLRAVMGGMHRLGHTCTVKAISQHLQKLRRKDGNGAAANGTAGPSSDGGAATTPKATPAKKRATPAAKGSTGKRGRKAKDAANDGDDDEHEETPTKKKVKSEKVKSEEIVKDEPEEDKDPIGEEDDGAI